ncbi:acyl carrier protein [Microbacterium sp. SORGH_AS_0888]|uniref:acyl carrier protein n=1 Tax=Microbacterium sp. SORGH_AS_0888 TaxID=3041791 RepID=UPI00278A8CDB|nr:acyl carrier protein [Microbacterium sp. SORGH_AS_0888]MDQ1128961.1 act minimal PKS acyl carrier protein [Microbacterium sp. SORGH_AS_0888]
MSTNIDIKDVWTALVEGSGTDDADALLTALETRSFDELGYDSLAVLETGLRLRRDSGADVPDTQIANAQTAQELINLINSHLPAKTAEGAQQQ